MSEYLERKIVSGDTVTIEANTTDITIERLSGRPKERTKFLIRNTTTNHVQISDLGIGIPPDSIFDLTEAMEIKKARRSESLWNLVEMGILAIESSVNSTPQNTSNSTQSKSIKAINKNKTKLKRAIDL